MTQNGNSKRIYPRVATQIFAYFLIVLGCFTLINTVNAASLDFSTSFGSYIKGGEFSIDVNVSSPDQSINASVGSISFPVNNLEVVSISKDNSIFNFWVQEPSFSNTLGTINFQGVIFNPGFQGEAGKIITIKFKVKKVGTANLNLSSGVVLANDGNGTTVPTTLGGKKVDLVNSN